MSHGPTSRPCALFQFTPLREGRQPAPVPSAAPPYHFNSRPCGRGDAMAGRYTSSMKYFNSRPCGRGDPMRNKNGYIIYISIHAPAGGATEDNYETEAASKFQFTPLREGRQQKGTKKENDYCTFCRKKRKVYLIIKRIRKNHQNPTTHVVQKFTPTLRRHAG